MNEECLTQKSLEISKKLFKKFTDLTSKPNVTKEELNLVKKEMEETILEKICYVCFEIKKEKFYDNPYGVPGTSYYFCSNKCSLNYQLKMWEAIKQHSIKNLNKSLMFSVLYYHAKYIISTIKKALKKNK